MLVCGGGGGGGGGGGEGFLPYIQVATKYPPQGKHIRYSQKSQGYIFE